MTQFIAKRSFKYRLLPNTYTVDFKKDDQITILRKNQKPKVGKVLSVDFDGRVIEITQEALDRNFRRLF